MHINTISELLIKGFLEPKTAAFLLGINAKSHQTFLDDIDTILSQVNSKTMKDSILLGTQNLDAHTSAIKKTLEKYSDLFIATQKDSQQKRAVTDLKVKAAILLGGALNKARSSAEDYLAETPTSVTSNSVISPGLDVLQDAAGELLIPGICMLGQSVYNEAKYLKGVTTLQNKIISAEMETAESHRLLQSAYENLRISFGDILEKIKNTEPIDEPLYQKTVEAWLTEERFLQQQIILQQEKIAGISAETQKLQSQRRLERITEGLGAAIAIASLAGPPAVIAGTAIKLMVNAGCALIGLKMIHESAELNQGIVKSTNIFLITHDESFTQATVAANRSKTPSIAFAGPLLESKKLFDIEYGKVALSKLTFSEKLQQFIAPKLAEAMANKAKNKTSCSYIPMSSTQYIPMFDSTLFTTGDFSTNKELKAAGKEALKSLVGQAESFLAELILLDNTIDALKKLSISPHITNLDEITAQLQNSVKTISEQKELMVSRMGDAYTGEARKTIQALTELENKIGTLLNNINFKKVHFEGSPFSTFFAGKEAVNLLTMTPEKRNEIVQAFAGEHATQIEARNTLLAETKFNIDALSTILTEQSKTEGRNISNFGSVIRELQEKLLILRDATFKDVASNNIKPETTNFFIKHNDCTTELYAIAQKGIAQLNARLQYLDTQKDNLTPQENYQELTSLRDSLTSIDAFYERNPLYSAQSTDTLLDRCEIDATITLKQKELLTALEDSLKTGPVFIHQTSSEDNNIQLTSRLFFGYYKHEEMEKDVSEKIVALNNKGITKLNLAPFNPLTEDAIEHCKDDPTKLGKLIEGLKTEIQWVSKFSAACESNIFKIQIENIDAIITSYEKQIKHIKNLTKVNPLDSGIFSGIKGTLAKDRSELAKAETALAGLKKYESILEPPVLNAPHHLL